MKAKGGVAHLVQIKRIVRSGWLLSFLKYTKRERESCDREIASHE